MAERVFKDFDLPREHLFGGQDYIPLRARKAEEIERRKNRPKGVLRSEQQERGLKMSATILRNVWEPEDIYFARWLLRPALFNSGWYEAARASMDVQRRRLKLPLFIEGSDHAGADIWTMLGRTADTLDAVSASAGKLITMLLHEAPRVERTEVQVGRQIGNASLLLSAANIGVIAPLFKDADIQTLVRYEALRVVQDARTLGEKIGSHPSVAQLPEPDSDLGVFWRREAPDGALEAYELAMAA